MKPAITTVCITLLAALTASCGSPDSSETAKPDAQATTSTASAGTATVSSSATLPSARNTPAKSAITGTNTGETTPPQQAPTSATSPAGKPVKNIAITFRKGQKVKPEKWEVAKGDHVIITIDSDKSEEFHLHGYDLKAKTNPGKPEKIEFDALIRGTFELESHHPAVMLGRLTVK